MTQNLTEMGYKQNIINEDLHRLLLKVTNQNDFEPIYEKTFGEKWEIDQVRNIRTREGENLKGYFLDSFDIIHTGSETESFRVTKEVFLVENGMILIFNHIEKYLEEPENDTFFNISYRELSMDQTLTTKEKLDLEKAVITEIKNGLSKERSPHPLMHSI